MNKGKTSYIVFLALIVIIIGSISCQNKTNTSHLGFNLQEFKIKNPLLDTILNRVRDSVHMRSNAEDVIVLILRVYDSKPEFCFTTSKAEDVTTDFIYQNNYRIVGYIKNTTPIIVLSAIMNKYEFENTFYDFLIPTNTKKYFGYILFPDDQYQVDEKGNPLPPPAFDPLFYFYRYDGSRFLSVKYGD